ncbi:MAG: polyprenol monophosphomannose synthase [Chloroflexi bacterium]|nr:polyprenol monophosphomannose synthase [Chloroflexota bacterium]
MGTSTRGLVIVPTYNERQNLEPLAEAVLRQGPFDLLVVDDGSPDGTGEVADALAQRFPSRVSVLHRGAKLGLGSAYVQGFKAALERGHERVFQMDADFSHDPRDLPRLRDALESADLAIGSRYVDHGGARHWPLWRRALSRGGSLYARTILGVPVHDLTSGFKGFRRQALEALELDAIRSNGYSFQIEVTYRCYEQGRQIKEVPILFVDRRTGASKMSPHIVLEAMIMVWRLRLGLIDGGEHLVWRLPGVLRSELFHPGGRGDRAA